MMVNWIMQVRYLRSYKSSKKSYQHNKKLLLRVEETQKLFESEQNHHSLHFKQITCKKDKNRYSIRVLNTSYRILMSIKEDIAEFKCICDHDEYQRLNKNC